MMKVNARGTVINLPSDLLELVPGSMLYCIASGTNDAIIERDENGAVMFDRDPKQFATIVAWLAASMDVRTLTVDDPRATLSEADFFGLDTLKEQLLSQYQTLASPFLKSKGMYYCAGSAFGLIFQETGEVVVKGQLPIRNLRSFRPKSLMFEVRPDCSVRIYQRQDKPKEKMSTVATGWIDPETDDNQPPCDWYFHQLAQQYCLEVGQEQLFGLQFMSVSDMAKETACRATSSSWSSTSSSTSSHGPASNPSVRELIQEGGWQKLWQDHP
eukprot:TRINITY_DN60308_c0_g1_i1.p1 TRINITY_DN60308_c0_g1~~TRINITY_DN60308_c0_g1_i1.p1  ORF type:complete len:271 (+),score=31.23 TRINITY_DN60308_c0_g1_i1:31-843(+)